MKKLTAALALAAALALTACSAPAPQAAGPLPASAAPTTPAITAAPIPAQAAAPNTAAASAAGFDLAYYLKGARAMWPEDVPVTDEQLIAAGKLACEQLPSARLVTKISVVDGGSAGDQKNLAVANAAASVMCPEAYPAPPKG